MDLAERRKWSVRPRPDRAVKPTDGKARVGLSGTGPVQGFWHRHSFTCREAQPEDQHAHAALHASANRSQQENSEPSIRIFSSCGICNFAKIYRAILLRQQWKPELRTTSARLGDKTIAGLAD